MTINTIRFSLAILLLFIYQGYSQVLINKWSVEDAWEWHMNYNWVVGTNFNPSTAINQIEMWQEETFDTETLDRELKWSAELGFNLHRVFLHNLVWQQNSEKYLNRIDQYLTIADRYGIKTMLVLLDDVWDPFPKLGKQPAPTPYRHNSGWVQSPGRNYLEDETMHPLIEAYVKGIIDHFKYDNRVAIWDLYNEPGNHNDGSYGNISVLKTELNPEDKDNYSFRLVKKVFQWAREINPSQPLTMGIWRGTISDWGTIEKLPVLDRFMIENSDIITFHTYDNNTKDVLLKIEELKKYKRPLICTEYMARTNNNTFNNMMPIFKKEQIGALNWGFVSGKTQTIYPWETWSKNYTEEPKIWFHDILRKDGTPFSEQEVDLIKKLTLSKPRR